MIIPHRFIANFLAPTHYPPNFLPLSQSFRNLLWSSNNGLPPDITDFDQYDNPQSLPQSFKSLLDILQFNEWHEERYPSLIEKVSVLSPSKRAVCATVAQCILSKPALLSALLDHNGVCDTTVEVLIVLVQSGKAKDDEPNLSLTEHAVNTLMVNIVHSPYLRQKIRSDPGLFSCLPPKLSVPPLVSTLSGEGMSLGSKKKDTIEQSITSVTLIALTHMCKVSTIKPFEIVDSAVDTICEIEGKQGEKDIAGNSNWRGDAPPSSVWNVKNICTKLGRSWRHCLLSSDAPPTSDGKFAEFLVASAQCMFKYPSSQAPLMLFGALIGDGSALIDIVTPNENSSLGCSDVGGIDSRTRRLKRVIYLATSALLAQGVEELERTLPLGNDENGDKATVFERLSPLLMLRRVPFNYFRLLHYTFNGYRERCQENLRSLANAISLRLNIHLDFETGDALSLHHDTTAEERRLSAELAGSCLPFSQRETQEKHTNMPCYHILWSLDSCIGRICIPSFRGAMHYLLVPLQPENSLEGRTRFREMRVNSLRSARTALYASCHHTPQARGIDDGRGLFVVASFAFFVLLIPIAENEDEDLVMLRTGCIEFFAICEESMSQWCASSKLHKDYCKPALDKDSLVEVESASHAFIRSPQSFVAALSLIHTLLIQAVTGTIPKKWIMINIRNFCDSHLLCKVLHGEGVDVKVAASSKILFLNAFVLSSSRCPVDDGTLYHFAKHVLPSAIFWGTDWMDHSEANICHNAPCVTALLQLVFTLLTRGKRFGCLLECNGHSDLSLEQKIRKVHGWALKAVRIKGCSDKSIENHSLMELRLAGLKIMLAIIAITKISDEQCFGRYFGPDMLVETFAVLRMANTDKNKNINTLAGHILKGLQQAIHISKDI